MCTSARTQFSSELWEASSGAARAGPAARRGPTATPGPQRGGAKGGAAAAKGLMAARPPAGSPPAPAAAAAPREVAVLAASGSRGSGLLPPSPRPPPPAGKPPSAYLHWVSAPHPPGQEQPSTTAKITENQSQHGLRGAGGLPGPPPAAHRAGGGGRPRREGTPPEVEPCPSSRPGGHRGTFCSRRPAGSREGHGRRERAEGRGRREAGGRASSAVGPREAPKGETRSSGGAFSDYGQKRKSKSGPGGEKNNRGDVLPLTRPVGLGTALLPQASIYPRQR